MSFEIHLIEPKIENLFEIDLIAIDGFRRDFGTKPKKENDRLKRLNCINDYNKSLHFNS